MTKLGFVIDQHMCIGCHACTVACKSENDIPVGDFRTWVKLVESGEFPDVTRSFLVERCNHCEAAPCVKICPVNALYKRPDGIVDFNTDQCIGCRACQAACPYDAIYMDPNRGHTVAKCNFCSHRIDQGLEPACVIVCPTQAIMFGDLNDPTSIVAQANRSGEALRPREELGTRPQLSYLGSRIEVMAADRTSAHPAAMMTTPWNSPSSGTPPTLATTGAAHDVYNVRHRSPWHFFVSAYMGVKSIASGTVLLAALALALGYDVERDVASLWAPILGLIFITVTSGLLVVDLERPERFLRVIFQPNWNSWLARGAYILAAFATLCALWLVLDIAGADGAVRLVAAVSVLVAVATATYTAFLFFQAPGRELWQTPAFLLHLAARAVVAGAAVWLLVGAVVDADTAVYDPLAYALAAGLAVSALCTFIEFSRRDTAHLRRATAFAIRGPAAPYFWGAIVLGHIIPAILIVAFLSSGGSIALLVSAAVLALAGQLVQDDVWVNAGQAVPQT